MATRADWPGSGRWRTPVTPSFEAMQRREVFGTSGPRITPRFFAGWNYAPDLCGSETLVAEGYAGGVPMGGDLEDSTRRGRQADLHRVCCSGLRPKMQRPCRNCSSSRAGSTARVRLRYAVRAIAGAADAEAGADTLCAVVQDEAFDAGAVRLLLLAGRGSANAALERLRLPAHRRGRPPGGVQRRLPPRNHCGDGLDIPRLVPPRGTGSGRVMLLWPPFMRSLRFARRVAQLVRALP